MIDLSDVGLEGEDCTDALQAALDSGAATVRLGPRPYTISRPLVMRQHTQRLVGEHTPTYDCSATPASTISRIDLAPGFEGRAAIEIAGVARGTRISDIMLAGNRVGDDVAGIAFPPMADYAGEQGVWIGDASIIGFSGPGITGRAHVAHLRDLHIAANAGGGIRVDGADRWNDCELRSLTIAFNGGDGIHFGGDINAGINIEGGRIERSGQTLGDPSNTLGHFNPDAAGIRITSGRHIDIRGVHTDANTGAGLHIEAKREGATLGAIHVYGFRAGRDGGGSQDGSDAGAAYRVLGYSGADSGVVREVHFHGCSVYYGRSTDYGDTPGLISPAKGLHLRHAWQCSWDGPEPATVRQDDAWLVEGTTWGTTIAASDRMGRRFAWRPHDNHIETPPGGTVTDTSFVLPSGVTTGWITATLVDMLDGAQGRLTLERVQATTTDDAAVIVRSSATHDLVAGRLPPVEVPVGVYRVRAHLAGTARLSSCVITVTEDHTQDAPLNLGSRWSDPDAEPLTPSQFDELAARIDALDGAPGAPGEDGAPGPQGEPGSVSGAGQPTRTDLSAGTVYTANTTTGVISSDAASGTQIKVGFTVEATRLVIRVAR